MTLNSKTTIDREINRVIVTNDNEAITADLVRAIILAINAHIGLQSVALHANGRDIVVTPWEGNAVTIPNAFTQTLQTRLQALNVRAITGAQIGEGGTYNLRLAYTDGDGNVQHIDADLGPLREGLGAHAERVSQAEIQAGTENQIRAFSPSNIAEMADLHSRQADWNETDSASPANIRNKPTIPPAVPSNRLIPTGGDSGQVLAKQSGTDYDTEWQAGGEANVQADWNEEHSGDDAFIKNKPIDRLLPTGGTNGQVPTRQAGGGVAWADQTGSGGGEQNVQADWDVTDQNSDAYIRNKPTSELAAAWADAGSVLVGGTGITVTLNASGNYVITATGGDGGGVSPLNHQRYFFWQAPATTPTPAQLQAGVSSTTDDTEINTATGAGFLHFWIWSKEQLTTIRSSDALNPQGNLFDTFTESRLTIGADNGYLYTRQSRASGIGTTSNPITWTVR